MIAASTGSHRAHGKLLLVLALLAPGLVAASEAPVALARLLALNEREPLAYAAVTDAWSFPELVRPTELGQALSDPDYADGRAALRKELEALTGVPLYDLYRQCAEHLHGPAALVLDQPEAGNETALRLTLWLTADTSDGAAALRKLWPHLPPQSAGLWARLRLEVRTRAELAAVTAVPEWSRRASQPAGVFRLGLRPLALKQHHAAVGRGGAEALPEAWRLASDWLSAHEIAELAWVVTPAETQLAEILRVELAPGAKGHFAILTRALRSPPRSWEALRTVLPGAPDAAVLLQLDLAALGEQCAPSVRLFERLLRGERWAREHARDPEVRDSSRYAALLEGLTGTAGWTLRLGEHDEMRSIAALAYAPGEVTMRRARTLAGLARCGAEFKQMPAAVRIGAETPWAATFRGSGLFIAPVLGFSEGWLWVCSSPESYQLLTRALQPHGPSLALESQQRLLSAPEEWKGWGAPGEPALRARLNLKRLFVTGYAAWLLGPGGPHLGTWRAPGDCFPPPAFFDGRFNSLYVEAARTEHGVSCFALGPAPGGGWVSVGLLAAWAGALAEQP